MDRVEWRCVPEFPSYEVNNIGEVISLRKGVRIMKQNTNHKGYKSLYLVNKPYTRKKFGVHQIVALAFIPNPKNNPEVNHINGIKSDNRVENLEWCTASENFNHAIRIGLIGTRKIIDTKTREIYPSIVIAAKSSGYSWNHLWAMLNDRYPNKTNLRYHE